MRARLLDLGEVGPVRSQSAYQSVLAGISRDDDPVVFLVRPSGPLALVGEPTESTTVRAAEIDLQACFDMGVPLVRRAIGKQTEILGEGDLLVQLVFPIEKTSVKAVAKAPWPVLQTLAGLRIDARTVDSGALVTATGWIGHSHASVVDSALCVAYCLYWNQRPAAFPRGGYSSLTAEMEEPVSFAELAELLLQALEGHFSLDLFPSLPTPGELEAIYEWDRRLLIETLEEASFEPTATASVH